jgi:hypothetical protein
MPIALQHSFTAERISPKGSERPVPTRPGHSRRWAGLSQKETFKTYDKPAQARCQPSDRAQLSNTFAPQRLSDL